ncbi:hypothetical protein CB1_000713011 [Camelus ferus]|nr:hypothetical protein CB1_000713011 [Camelus ferus]
MLQCEPCGQDRNWRKGRRVGSGAEGSSGAVWWRRPDGPQPALSPRSGPWDLPLGPTAPPYIPILSALVPEGAALLMCTQASVSRILATGWPGLDPVWIWGLTNEGYVEAVPQATEPRSCAHQRPPLALPLRFSHKSLHIIHVDI